MNLNEQLDNAVKAVNGLLEALNDSKRVIKQLPNELAAADKRHSAHVVKLHEDFNKKQAGMDKQIQETAAALAHAKRAEEKAVQLQQEASALHTANVKKAKELSDKEALLNKAIAENTAKEAALNDKLDKIASLQKAI